LLNASVGVQRVLARLRPVQFGRSTATESLIRHRLNATALVRRASAQLARVPAATAARLRPDVTSRRPAAISVARHSATTPSNRRSALAPRSVPAEQAMPVRPTADRSAQPQARRSPIAPRSSMATPSVAIAPALAHRSLVSRIGAERAVPVAVIAIVLIATALSSAPSFGSNGPVGGPNGDGPDARLAVGGVEAAQGQPGTELDGDVEGTTDEAAGIDDRGVDGVAPEEDLGNVEDAYVDDGTLLKPVAVDTTVSDGKGLMRTYRVRNGDTLTGIARKFGVSMMTVWWANHLTAKDDLVVGRFLTIPPVNGVVVTVGSSDTLESLAAKYGVEASAIVEANALQDPNLVIGQTLTVPGALGDSIATPKPARTPSRSSGGSSHAPSRSVSGPSRYSGGKFAWPVAGGYISQYFHYGHYAIDIAADRGTPVKAAASGVVTFAGWKSNGGGYQVWISHGSGLYTTYNHMSSISVGRGQHVGRGQMVGRVGMSGNATGPHLHFEVWRGPVWDGGTRVNPLIYL
jgi:murein DD-endopeptidase MepM/ murein hydrolase activator NlpD